MGLVRTMKVAALAGAALVAGCGGTRVAHVALLSQGDLAGKSLAVRKPGPVLTGEDCGMHQNLSNAFRNAVAGTDYDTLVDVEVTNTTAAIGTSNCISVKGAGIKSAELYSEGGAR